MLKHLHISLYGFICITFFAGGQTAIKRERFFSIGLNAGIIGWSPTSTISQNSTYFKRTVNYGVGNLSDASGHNSLNIIQIRA